MNLCAFSPIKNVWNCQNHHGAIIWQIWPNIGPKDSPKNWLEFWDCLETGIKFVNFIFKPSTRRNRRARPTLAQRLLSHFGMVNLKMPRILIFLRILGHRATTSKSQRQTSKRQRQASKRHRQIG
jgi:hypothetical protein